MTRTFKLTIRGKDKFKDASLALQCKEAIIKEMPYFIAVHIKEFGKKPSRNWEKK